MSESSEAPRDAAAHAAKCRDAPGVRFVVPTDEDLIVHYLGRKLRGEPLPTDLVFEGRDAYAEHPEKLVAKLGDHIAIDGAWYLFSARERRNARGTRRPRRVRRLTGDGVGFWKLMGPVKQILSGADEQQTLGTKRGLWYYENVYDEEGAMGKRKRDWSKNSKPTRWRMVEFIASDSNRILGDDTAPDRMLLNDFVLCKITSSRRRPVKVENRGPAPAQGDEEENDDDDDYGEEEPTSEGGGESHEKHLSGQQPAGGGGGGARGDQQRPPPFGGAGSHGNQQPTTAGTALLDDFYPVDGSNWSGTTMRSIFGFSDHIGAAYGGGEMLDAQQPAGGGGAGARGDQHQRPPPFGGAAGSHGYQQLTTMAAAALLDELYLGSSHGYQQPAATAGAALLDDFDLGLDDPNWFENPIILDFDGDIGRAYGGGETLDVLPAWLQQAESSGGGAGSSSDKQQQPTPPPDEQQQPTPEAPNEEEGAAATAAGSQHAAS